MGKSKAKARSGPKPVQPAEPWVPAFKATLWTRAFQRWIGVTALFAFGLIVYTQHPYYRNSGEFMWWRKVFPPFFLLWLLVGSLYLKVTLQRWSAMRYLMRDTPLHLLLLFRAAKNGRFWRRVRNRRMRTTVLGIVIKAFYLPLMIGWVIGHFNGMARLWLRHKQLSPMDYKMPPGSTIIDAARLWWEHIGSRITDFIPNLHDFEAFVQPWAWSRADFSWGLDFSYQTCFAVDCGFALIGYGLECRWLDNKTRSVEPTAFGWLVCLACYTPFNGVLGGYLPLANGPAVITSANVLLVFRALTVFLFAIYAAATVAFGARFSNMTNRGIIARGPYRYVRHPAYATKCTAWWLENMPTMTFTKGIFLSALCGVYALRAWTEERHLNADPDYLAYKQRTPWVMFPGVY